MHKIHSMHRFLLFCGLLLSSNLIFAQTIVLQEDFNGGIPAGWQVIDDDGHPLHSSMTQFTDAWIPYVDGTDSCAASSSYFDDTLQASDYLILPKQSLLTFSKLSWEGRSVDASFPDGYYVLLSTTDSNLTSFTDTVLAVFAEHYQWNRKSVLLDTMGYANQDVFIAFKNFTEDGFILLLDDIMLEVSDFTSIPPNEKFEYVIYPNPTSDILSIQSNAPVQFEIYDLQGRLLISDQGNSVDVSALSNGQYLIMINSEQGSSTQSFIKR